MISRQLLARSLTHYWRSHLAVLLCVIVGTAVLAGALLVGDSMRGSLRDLTLDRLGRVDYVLHSARFFRQALEDELQQDYRFRAATAGARGDSAESAILLHGSAARVDETGQEASRAGRVQVLGVTAGFWSLARSGQSPAWVADWGKSQNTRTVVLGETLAQELEAQVGDTVLLRFEQPSDIPREAILGRKQGSVRELRLTLMHIVPRREMGAFALAPNQHTPRNAYLPLASLQRAIEQTGRVNAILVAGPVESSGKRLTEPPHQVASDLQRLVAEHLTLQDLGLRLRHDARRGYFSLESTRIVLQAPVAQAALEAASELQIQAEPTVIYLANSIRQLSSTVPTASVADIPYSTVAALDPAATPPLGPLQSVAGEAIGDLADNEILLNTWAAEELNARPGDEIQLTYFAPEPASPADPYETLQAKFQVRGVVAMTGVGADPGLVPEYRGITDAETYADWEPPFPMDLTRVRAEDEEYWDQYGATPKAFVSLSAGERLWGSRFGNLTSIRLAAGSEGAEPAGRDKSLGDRFARALLERLPPEQFGLAFQPVKAQGLEASRGATDFAGLFIGFSLFLIVAAAMLIGLVFRLGVERRAKELGLLLAVGFDQARVRRMVLAEGLLLTVVGTSVGLAGAAGYAWLMMAGLRSWWQDAVGTTLLRLHVSVGSLVIGTIAGLLLGGVAILWALRGLTRLAPRALLAGSVTSSARPVRTSPRWSRCIATGSAVAAIALTAVVMVTGVSPAAFFGVGALLLLACLSLLIALLTTGRGRLVQGQGLWAMARLGIRNGARHRGRSALTAGLVACATFVIVAVGASRHNPAAERPEKFSGNGGFALMAESDIPLLHDLNTLQGRLELGFQEADSRWFEMVRAYPFRLLPGEDASCLNLYQPTRPRILGATRDMIARGGFIFQASLAESDVEGQNPWLLLERELPEGAVPALGDANTLQWILHLGFGKQVLGKQLAVTAEDGRQVPLEIVGMLGRSIFQSELVISDANFEKLFPSRAGWSYFLIETDQADNGMEKVQSQLPPLGALLEERLSHYGFDVSSTAQRLAEYLAVENTYLSTFQTLGGLGLVLGTLGLGAVMLRNVLERRGELALLRAVGFAPAALVWVVLAENLFLLLAGLTAGTVAALVAVAPHLLSAGSDVPWLSLAGMLALVLAGGMIAGIAAMLVTLRTPLLPALRAE